MPFWMFWELGEWYLMYGDTYCTGTCLVLHIHIYKSFTIYIDLHSSKSSVQL